MPVLAFTTTAIFLDRPGRPQVQGFFEHSPATMASASRIAHYVQGSARIYIHPDTPPYPVEHAHPAFYKPEVHAGIGCTVSLWTSLEGAFAFAYSGMHAKALALRKAWFAKGDWPVYAAWWADDGYRPTFPDAARRLEHLQASGPSPFAFDFRQAFDSRGEPVRIDREGVKRLTPGEA